MDGCVRAHASKSCRFTRSKSSTDWDTSAPAATTPGSNSQSQITVVRSGPGGIIRCTIAWSGTRLMKTCGLMVIAKYFRSWSSVSPGSPVGEGRSVAHVVLGRVPAGELGQHADQLGVDGGAVVALHEVLDDEL